MSIASLPAGFVPTEEAVFSIQTTAVGSAYSGSLVIPLGLIVFYCPVAVRKSPVFPTLIICLLLGITYGFLNFHTILGSIQLKSPGRGVFLGSISLILLIPIFTDSVLIWKILWLFSALNYSKYQRALLASPPTIITIPRLVIASYFLSDLARIYDDDSTGAGMSNASRAILTVRIILVEYILQFISNLYCSVILLYREYQLTKDTQASNIHISGTLRKRFNNMLRILASYFIIPVCIELAIIITTVTTDNQLIRESLQWSNTYVPLHCAVLATVWSSIGQSNEQNKPASNNIISKSSSRFARIGKTPSSSEVGHSHTLTAHCRIGEDDVEANIERTASLSSEGKLPIVSISDHGSPNLSFTGSEKSSDFSFQLPMDEHRMRSHSSQSVQ